MNAVGAALTRHACEHADRPALTGHDGTLGYAELYRRACAVGAHLAAAGLGPGDRVAVHGEKSVATVTGLLGCLLAGVAYVPLDPGAPPARRQLLAGDAGCARVLAPARVAGRVRADLGGVYVDAVEVLAARPAGDWTPVHPAPDTEAYVMYTSGSTGRPKGVRVPHRALRAFFAAVHPLMSVDPGAVCLNTSALHFDVSVIDLLYPLVRGAHVRLGPAVPTPGALLDAIQSAGVTHMAAVGSTLTLLATHRDGLARHNVGKLRRIMTGAEVLNPATVQAWLAAAPCATVINGYGPTEATCLVLAHVIAEREPDRQEHYPIGSPLSGVRVLFRADDGTCGDTGPGEILVAGDQVMLGYTENAAEEEAAAFLDVAGVRYYRTGDLGRRGADGLVHFICRRDDEVKIRGYRINLNEVRRVVEAHPRVDRAFVAAVPDRRTGLALACAVTPTGQAAGPGPAVTLEPAPGDLAGALLDHVASALPRYMVPQGVYRLTGFPTLSTGKPDAGLLRRLLGEAHGLLGEAHGERG